METHPRYSGVPVHLLAAAVRDDVGRLNRDQLLDLANWLGEQLQPLPPAAAQPRLQVLHIMHETIEVTALEERRQPGQSHD
jgi:hypothetical protein